jgi:glycerophosphoryl diester phosphodiesterase
MGRGRVFCCHRANYSRQFPPNSLAAIRECVAAGVPRLEIDVRFLADDAMFIFHDAHLDDETTGSGRVSDLDSAAARALRFSSDSSAGPCFLDDVVAAMAGSPTLLQVDLKLMRPLSERRLHLLAGAIAPLGAQALVGSQAHWNLRPLRDWGVPVAFDTTLQWYHDAGRTRAGLTPSRRGLHGLWDDAPIAHIPAFGARDYAEARIDDLAALLPGAVEWMVDIATVRHLGALGVSLGAELAHRGIALAAWTMRDTGPDTSTALLRELFALGATTIITDDAAALAGYARGIGEA